MSDDTRELAAAWMVVDPVAADRETVAGWLANDPAALQQAFGAPLVFGTAGLRGPLRPGPGGMNRLMVRRVTAAIGDYLLDQGCEGPVVIGFDGRHGSREFAEDAGRVLEAMGRKVFRFVQVIPTPVVAWAVRELGASAGLVVTASHNPPQDNGYKVFWGDGAQIVPPHDSGIASALARKRLEEVPLAERAGDVIPPALVARYVDAVMKQRVRPSALPLRIVYTPLHGVGAELISTVLSRGGYDDLHIVAAQAQPDGDFPTVAFPNPEENGALDLAMALGDDISADVVVANDPDADRLAVAVPVAGGWRRLTGNELGSLLGDELLTHGHYPEPRGVATTLVSSTRLAAIAAAHGVEHATTLTGFKWLARVSMDLAARGGTMVLGYEEALGYSVGGLVRDKDGISAALVLCDLAAVCKAEGRTLIDLLDAQDARFGALVGRQRAMVEAGPQGKARIAASMARLRQALPTSLAGVDVVAVSDLQEGLRRPVTGPATPLIYAKSNVLDFELQGGHRALVRPSGTEPKLKLYIEATAPKTGDLAADRASASAMAERIENDLLQRLGK